MMKKLFTIWMVALALSGLVLAQEPAELIAIADAYGVEINAHDLDAMMSYWADDIVYDYVPLPTPVEGKEGVRAFFEGLFVGFPDVTTTEGRVLAADNIVVVEHGLNGTHQGPWLGVPPTGNVVSAPHIDIYEFEGDKVKRMSTYLDATSVMIQLGVVPTPDMPTLVPSFTLPDPEPTGLSPMEADVEHMIRYNGQDIAHYAKMFRSDAQIFPSPLGVILDRNAWIAMDEMTDEGFSDGTTEIVRRVDLGDGWILAEMILRSIHTGTYLGVPASGNMIDLKGAYITHYDADGLITHHNIYYDSLTLISQMTATSFTDCGSGTTTQLFAGGATWQLNWGQGPWTWSTITGQSLLDSNVSAVLDLLTTAPADVSADLVATLPIAGTLTLTAHDAHFPEVTTGTMVLSGAGINVIDINASRVIVDEWSGMFLAPFHPPGPQVTLALESATGVFAHITQVSPWQLSLAGSYAIPLIDGLELQDNILTALGGKVPLIGGIGEFSLSGLYTVNAAKLPQDFCEYGTATTARLAPDGGGWDQQWGMAGPLDWIECTTETDVPFLNENVTGNLTTYVTGLPDISSDMILHIPLGGQMVITEHSADNPDEVIGQITFDVLAMFAADMNADRAVVDEAGGTITVVFGAAVEEGPDGLMTVTEATGSLADITQVSPWEWHVNGTMQIVRVPELPLQTNLLAALQQSELLLGAEEEFALTGAYYRSPPQE